MNYKNAAFTVEFAQNGYVIRKNWEDDRTIPVEQAGLQPTSAYQSITEVAENEDVLVTRLTGFIKDVRG